MKRRALAAFTLIEFLIVVAVIGILAAVLIPNLLEARSQAQIRALQVHSKSVHTAAIAWLASDGQRGGMDAVDVWSPCLSAIRNDGYGTPAAPVTATACDVVADGNGAVDVIVKGDVNGTELTFVNGGLP